MSVIIKKTESTPSTPFSNVPVPGLFEHASVLHVKIPDSVPDGSKTVRNAIRLSDFKIVSFQDRDAVIPATASVTIEYSTTPKGA